MLLDKGKNLRPWENYRDGIFFKVEKLILAVFGPILTIFEMEADLVEILFHLENYLVAQID